jgi:hypothetical protein
MTHLLDPFVVAENTQSLGYRLVDAAGTNFNRMFNLLKIETGHFAGLQSHNDDLSCFAFSSPERGGEIGMEQKKKRAIGGGGSLLNARFFKQSDSQGRSLRTDHLGSDSLI